MEIHFHFHFPPDNDNPETARRIRGVVDRLKDVVEGTPIDPQPEPKKDECNGPQ